MHDRPPSMGGFCFWGAHHSIGFILSSVAQPISNVDALIEHRLEREEQIVSCIEGGIYKISEMVPKMYSGTQKHMHPAAERSVLAAMANLIKKGRRGDIVMFSMSDNKIDIKKTFVAGKEVYPLD